jgi:hypothetical protein
MVHPPTAEGLVLCQKIIIEQRTGHRTLVNSMTKVWCRAFPSPPQRLEVYAVLRDGLGVGLMSFAITQMDNLEAIFARRWRMRFPDPLSIARLHLRPRVSFPASGRYQFSLLADGELVAQTFLTITP